MRRIVLLERRRQPRIGRIPLAVRMEPRIYTDLDGSIGYNPKLLSPRSLIWWEELRHQGHRERSEGSAVRTGEQIPRRFTPRDDTEAEAPPTKASGERSFHYRKRSVSIRENPRFNTPSTVP